MSNHVSITESTSRSGSSGRWMDAPSRLSQSPKESESSSGSAKPIFSAIMRHTSCGASNGGVVSGRRVVETTMQVCVEASGETAHCAAV